MYIQCLSFLGLAKVKKLPPQLAREEGKRHVDVDTVRAVIGNRFQVMSDYYKRVVCPILQNVKRSGIENKDDKRLFQRAGVLLRRQDILLSPGASSHLKALLERYEQLRIVYSYRQSLQNVWLKTATSQKELIEALQQWCKQAEESGLEVLHQFAQQLKGYVPKPVMA